MSDPSDYIVPLLQQLQTSDESTRTALLEAASDEHPSDPRPLLLLAGFFAESRDMDRAEASYLAALQRDPDFAIARFQLGLLQFTSARPAVALATWAPLKKLPELNALRLFSQAFACLAEDRFDDALRLLREGIGQNSENPPLNQDMAMLIDRLVQAKLVSEDAETPEGSHLRAEGPEDVKSSVSEVQAHFLLSAYRTPE